MTQDELLEKLNEIQKIKCETQTLELKAAKQGCPRRLYDTLSSFSNQDDGGIIIFGVDEENNFEECGVYDPQDIQKKIAEQCLQMEPPVRPLLTVTEKAGKFFVSAEIPGADVAERPCYYKGQGRLKGSHVRVGDCDEPMTEYEVYSYEAFRKKYQDDVRPVPRALFTALDAKLLAEYIRRLKAEKPNLAALEEKDIYELMSITRKEEVTLSAVLLFCRYPQAYFPQLCITAVALPGMEAGEVGEAGERFLDNRRIEGTIPEMLEQAIAFVRKNIRTKTIIDPVTGRREDRTDYPMTAVREAILNTLVHRDYSMHTEGMPVQLAIYPNRIVIGNPGGIYGRLRVSQLGKVQPDTRNPVLATALEVLGVTENRYSGIPTIRRAMEQFGLREPVFLDERGSFTVILYNDAKPKNTLPDVRLSEKDKALLQFLRVPRTRQEIVNFLGLNSATYAMRTYVDPLVEHGLITLSIPEKPTSQNQRFLCAEAKGDFYRIQ
ncbi:MAG: putative DNA binding domain-containing protein [Acidaminococcaceae bacterium]|nr:putative DNA binding domain-containing protein [Acidaminococcaceae bacterium]